MPAFVQSVPDPPSRRELWAWAGLVAALVLVRTWPYAWWGTLAFDADQAVVGLMAKHIAEFRAFPVYQYALPYVLIVSAYVTAPFMWVFGATPFALKLPLVLMNAGVAMGLVLAIVRTGVRPAVAVLVSLPVVAVGAVSNAGLMDALGMTVEPAVFVLVLWAVRRQPLTFGAVAAVGFHVREFVAYGVAAMLAIDVLCGVFTTARGWQRWGQSAVVALGTTALISGVARFGAARGPDTWTEVADGNLATLSGAFCFAPAQAVSNLAQLATSYLGMLLGASPTALSDGAVQSTVRQGLTGAWPVLAGVLLLVAGVLAVNWRVLWVRRHEAVVQLAAFLVLVGAQGVLVYAISRCGPLAVITVRYALLGVFLPTGLALALWAIDPPRGVRHVVATAFLALAAANTWTHVQLWQEQHAQPAISNRALLGPALEAQHLRYIRSDYWTAYYVAFITQERVVAGADTLSRIDEYERLLARHAREVMRVSTTPCDAGPPIVPGYHVCRDLMP